MAEDWVTVDDVSPPVPVVRFIRVPVHLVHFVNGTLFDLSRAENYVKNGNMSPAQTAGIFFDVFNDYLESTNMIIGLIVPYVRSSLPSNVLPCDGSTYQRVDYPSLYAVLPAFLIVDSDTFQTPDLNGRFIVGAGNVGSITVNMGDVGGEAEHTLTVPEMPSHTHTQTNIIFNVDVEPPLGVPDPSGAGLAPPTQTGSTGGDQPHNNLPPYYGLLYGIIAR